jgi:oligoendopeptidase F
MWDFIVKYWLEFVFGLIVTGLSAAYAHLAKRFKAERAKNQAIENGLRGILRIQILDTYDRCVADGNRISISRKDAVVSIYQSYCALGDSVDDTIKQLYEEIVHMAII